jgi:hypothetical protein
LSRAFNMSPVKKEQLLQYQKQRKSQQGQGSLSKSSGLVMKKKSPKEAVPEQQVMNPLYLLFSPLSATAPVLPAPSATPNRRYARLPPFIMYTRSHARTWLTPCQCRRRYGTTSGRTLNASDRVVSSFGLVTRRKVVHNNSSGSNSSSSEPQPERVVINPLLRLRPDLTLASARGPDSPPSPMTRFTTSAGAAPTIFASLSGAMPATSQTPLTDRSPHSPTGAPLSMSESTKRALGQKNSASLIDTNRGASSTSAEADKPLKKTLSSPDINPNKRRADTIARRQERDVLRPASADAAVSDEDETNEDDNAPGRGEDDGDGEYDEENEEDEGYSSVDGDLRALGREREHLASDDAWTTSEEDRATDPADRRDSCGVPVLNLSPLVHRRKVSDPADAIPVSVQRSSSHQFGSKLNSLSSSSTYILTDR